MNPTLRKLSDARLTPIEIATLLEKHIGSGSDDFHCRQALDALERIPTDAPHVAARVLARLVETDASPCDTIKLIIARLRREGGA
jgi:hypothetical protein